MNNLKNILLKSSRNYGAWSQLNKYSLVTPEVERDFRGSLSKIVDEVTNKRTYLLPLIKDQIKRIAEYNIEQETNPSSFVMLHAFDSLRKTEKLTPKETQQAFVLAWAVEMLQSYRAILQKPDKKIDAPLGLTLETGLKPANLSNLLRCFAYLLLENYFEGETIYKDLIRLYNKGFTYNFIEEIYLNSYKTKNKKYAELSMQHYDALCEYRTAYNMFKLPLLFSMQLTKTDDLKIQDDLDKICFDLGKLYQIKEEYNTCFAEDFQLYGSDDEVEMKCSWFAIMALQRCSNTQRVVFNTCYSSKEPAHVERLKLLYEQLKLPQLYREQEGLIRESVSQKAEVIASKGVPSSVFFKLIDF